MRRTLPCAVALLLGLAVAVHAQGPPVPQPGPEHELLARAVGEWNAEMEMTMAPGMPPMTANGTEKISLVAGRWMITEFESEMMGQPFEGHGIDGWDPERKAYVSVWVDSMSTSPSHGEATYDAETRTSTGWMESKDPATGATVKAKVRMSWPDDDTRIFELFPSMEAEEPNMTIKYTRKK